jgi:acetyl-CoA carboxylase/biotin carboxylase 1
MARLDSEYAQLKAAAENPGASAEEKTAATAKLEAREKHLAPAYQSVALEFADLHDRSGRMKAKADCVPCDWENSRRAIYWSLRRKISETVSEGTRITNDVATSAMSVRDKPS